MLESGWYYFYHVILEIYEWELFGEVWVCQFILFVIAIPCQSVLKQDWSACCLGYV